MIDMTEDSLSKDRLKNSLPNFYDKEDGSNIDKLVEVIGLEYDELLISLYDILDTHMVTDATGIHLEKIAKIFDLERNPNETDSEFRERIITHMPGFIGGGTENALRNVFELYIGSDYYRIEEDYTESETVDSNIDPSEPTIDQYGRFRFYLDPSEGRKINFSNLFDELNKYKASGIEIEFGALELSDRISIDENLNVNEGLYEESMSIGEDDEIQYHRTDLTKTDSANIIK